MDEAQYRKTYHAINERRCHFEKALNARTCACRCMRRFNLADREGVGCTESLAHERCGNWLHLLRPASRFALAQAHMPDILPHRLEAKVQTGGLLGLAMLLETASGTEDIAALLERAADAYGDLAGIPLHDIIPSVAAYEPRRKRERRVRP